MNCKQINSQITGVSFGVYNCDQIKHLSVLEVQNAQTFDALGHPMNGGLCDNAFGPINRNEFCRTCGLGDNECNGHFGHISLPLPVFNPFLIKQLFQILKMCCFDCNHLLFNATTLETIIAQMEAFNRGLDGLVDELESYASSLTLNTVSLDVMTIRQYIRDKLYERIEEESNKRHLKSMTNVINVKNVVEKQQNLFKTFMSGKLLKPNKVCQQCNSRKQGMTVLNNALIVLNMTKAGLKQQKNKKNSEENADKSEDLSIQMKGKSHLTPLAARSHLRALWSNEKESLSRIFPFLNLSVSVTTDSTPMDVFFLDTITIPPNRYRPMHFLNGRQFEAEQTAALSQIIIAAEVLSSSLRQAKHGNRLTASISSTSPSTSATTPNLLTDKSKDIAKFHLSWQKLQLLCNRLYDSDMDRLPDNKYPGVKQTLEKKEGLFRKHMMGKRVNFAARSVISPDPYIMADEIGIPLVFATNLSYPQPVTPWNVNQLRQMVLNGPDKHPGALSIQFEDGNIVRLRADDLSQRKSIAERLSHNNYKSGPLNGVKIVNRHLITGDALLLNRQPTLHKPSIMAHKARVLPKEKTLRLHYANCKCYNADFDGDEMNAHFPQSELARSEAYNIASVNYQYLVPKDGTPLSGLIQDHIIAGVLLTIRGKFFNKGDYQELLYGALSFLNKPLKLLTPAILKPKQLWSGKQIVSTLLLNIVPNDKPLPTLSIASKISPKILQSRKPRKWTAGGTPLQLTDMCESHVIIRKGELICGIIDKVNLGPNPYGLIHCCYELYGGSVSSALLTSFARLCTNYLQIHHGFTLGILDILVDKRPNAKRRKYIQKSLTIGDKAAAEALGVPNHEEKDLLLDKLKSAHTNKNDFYMKLLDKSMKGQTDDVNNKITEVCLPKGLVKQFPENNLQMMIQAGAKGGSVNAIQISCLLGQIELEGRRIPLMMSGRTLPSFKPYETEPRAGGFVSGRFMTGIRPQEFFFHCMAGREGLIDTAVKTSRSGYLQRCLIKHLEGLVVNYDMTVRDSEGSLVQLLYGEDGLDILKSQMLKEKVIPIVIQNNDALRPSNRELEKLENMTEKDLQSYQKSIQKWLEQNGNIRLKQRNSAFLKYSSDLNESNQFSKEELVEKWFSLKKKLKKTYQSKCKPCPDPVNSKFRTDLNLGAITEKLDSIIANYINKNPNNLLNNSCDPLSISSTEYRRTMNSYYMRSLCQPGEAVGLLAAQSVGEPSTQMTLNTFHFAGRGEMNVTLGIPRLREILMTASAKIATPSMDIPFLVHFDGDIDKEAENMRLRLTSVKLSDVLEYVDISETLEISELIRFRSYDIKFNFLPKSYYKQKCFTNPSLVLKYMEEKFFKILLESINRKIKALSKSHGLFDHSSRVRATTKAKVDTEDADESNDPFNNDLSRTPVDEEEMSSDDEREEVEVDTTTSRNKTRHNQDLEYEEPDDEEIEIINNSDIEEIDDDIADEVNNNRINQSENTERDHEFNENQIEDRVENSRVIKKRLKQAKKAELLASLPERQNKVKNISPSVVDYDFDTSREEWCRIRIKYDLINSKLDMSSLIEEEAKRAYVHKVGHIERAFLVKDNEAAKRNATFSKLLKTEGVSLLDVVAYDYIFDINRLYTNDIHAIANTYGIEAGAQAIQREIANVFAVYGIYVDSRHLSLISDYMTFSGEIKGMNRQSMDGVSPIQAMTFETTTNFLKTATLIGIEDSLTSPSARIVVGRPPLVGTGLMEMVYNPVLLTGTQPQLSFGNEIRKSKWKSNHSSPLKRKYSNKLAEMPILNKRIKYNL